MSLVKKVDVKNHISSRFRKEIRLFRRESQPDATGSSVAEVKAANAKQSEFVEDYSAEHAVAGKLVTPKAEPGDFTSPQAPAALKSVQA